MSLNKRNFERDLKNSQVAIEKLEKKIKEAEMARNTAISEIEMERAKILHCRTMLNYIAEWNPERTPSPCIETTSSIEVN